MQELIMCDFSLQHVASRPAKVGDKLVTTNFGTGTHGFAPEGQKQPMVPQDLVAVCLLPGTELAFDHGIGSRGYIFPKERKTTVARFTQVKKDIPHVHHDALELPDGEIVMLTILLEGQTATVLQLPAAPKTVEEAEAQRRVEVVG
jgi:hypothetical protein